MTNFRIALLSLALSIYVYAPAANATATYEDNTLSMPFVVYQDSLYSVDLIIVAGSDPVDFSLGANSEYPAGTEVPANAALFAGNVLSIPVLRVGTETYSVQLDFIESDTLFRLLDSPALITANTDGVVCSYTDSTPNNQESLTLTSTSSWTCADGERILEANGVPDHDVGAFPNPGNPSEIEEQSVSASMTLTPTETGEVTTLGGPSGATGYVLNGIKIDASTGGTCDDSGDNCSLNGNVGSWNLEALNQSSFDFGTDDNNAHVQPGGVYHYHGMPEGFIEKQGGNSSTMTLIGWAADGFPIYARYGYSDPMDSTSPIRAVTGSYQFVTDISESRPSVELYALGTFSQDYEYINGSGDLDECNGRFGVTPEFPEGIYHYYATDTYPFFQRCVTGLVENAGGGPAGQGGPPPGM